MTKLKFFEMLDRCLASHNSWSKLTGDGEKYNVSQLKPYVFHEDPAKLAAYREQDPDYAWTSHASGFTLADCWHIEAMQHKTAEAAEQQAKIFTRWIAEYKELNK